MEEYIEIDGEYFVVDPQELDPLGGPIMVPITQEEYEENT